jgi:hypothetical protein
MLRAVVLENPPERGQQAHQHQRPEQQPQPDEGVGHDERRPGEPRLLRDDDRADAEERDLEPGAQQRARAHRDLPEQADPLVLAVSVAAGDLLPPEALADRHRPLAGREGGPDRHDAAEQGQVGPPPGRRVELEGVGDDGAVVLPADGDAHPIPGPHHDPAGQGASPHHRPPLVTAASDAAPPGSRRTHRHGVGSSVGQGRPPPGRPGT